MDYKLALYYRTFFPYDLIWKWLSYGNPNYFQNREVSFELATGAYIRYISFKDNNEFVNYVLKKVPIKIDVGAVYSAPTNHVYSMTVLPEAIEKELVFDIDITDYDEIRTCCAGTDICNKCWKFLALACKILDRLIREDFGFKNVLWVFSGRRGIHCWVCDKEARNLTEEERTGLLSYITLIKGGSGVSRRVQLPCRSLHTSINHALNIISENFVDFIIKEQNVLGTDDGLNKFLNIIKDLQLDGEDFGKELTQYKTSEDRWIAFLRLFDEFQEKKVTMKYKYLKEEIMLHYAYPRLDANVTTILKHLLKLPFCVHPGTGNICIPFLPAQVDEFNLNDVPTIKDVIKQYHDCKKNKEAHYLNNLLRPRRLFIAFLNKLQHVK